MAIHMQRRALAPKHGKVAVILMTALLVALASGCAPQPAAPAGTGGPSPSSAVAWVQPNSQGGRDVYYLAPDGKPVLAGQVPAAGPSGSTSTGVASAAIAACIWTPFGKVC